MAEKYSGLILATIFGLHVFGDEDATRQESRLNAIKPLYKQMRKPWMFNQRAMRRTFIALLVFGLLIMAFQVIDLRPFVPLLKPMAFTIKGYIDRVGDFLVYGAAVDGPPLYESRSVALRLLALKDRLEATMVSGRPVSYRDLHELQRVMLDLNGSAQLPAMAVHFPEVARPVTCPETYLGPKHAVGWITVNCSRGSIWQELVTVVIGVPGGQTELLRLLRDFKESYPRMPVIVAGSNGSILPDGHPGRSWNEAFQKVDTPFTLVATGLVRFSDRHSDLRRSLRLLTEVPGVAVVGGAMRNATGHWKLGCFQSKLTGTGHLVYQWGYHRSQNESMYCDYVDGPILAYTSVLRKYKMDESMGPMVMLQDFFLRLRDEWLAMAAPDVMFFADGLMVEGGHGGCSLRETWMLFVQKWQLACVAINYKNARIAHAFSSNFTKGPSQKTDTMRSNACQQLP